MSIFDISRSPILKALKSNKIVSLGVGLVILIPFGNFVLPKIAEAASYGGSCYRYDAWYNGFNMFCNFPTGGGTYSNMRSISWTGGNGARLAWVRLSPYSESTCDISSGRVTCFNPYGQGNVKFRIQPYNNRTTTFFNLNSY